MVLIVYGVPTSAPPPHRLVGPRASLHDTNDNRCNDFSISSFLITFMIQKHQVVSRLSGCLFSLLFNFHDSYNHNPRQ